jgi:hypothetical protein
VDAGLGRLNGIELVMNRRGGGAGKIVDRIRRAVCLRTRSQWMKRARRRLRKATRGFERHLLLLDAAAGDWTGRYRQALKKAVSRSEVERLRNSRNPEDARKTS